MLENVLFRKKECWKIAFCVNLENDTKKLLLFQKLVKCIVLLLFLFKASLRKLQEMQHKTSNHNKNC